MQNESNLILDKNLSSGHLDTLKQRKVVLNINMTTSAYSTFRGMVTEWEVLWELYVLIKSSWY